MPISFSTAFRSSRSTSTKSRWRVRRKFKVRSSHELISKSDDPSTGMMDMLFSIERNRRPADEPKQGPNDVGRSPQAQLIILQHDIIRVPRFARKVAVRKKRTMDQIGGPIALWIEPILPDGLSPLVLNDPS